MLTHWRQGLCRLAAVLVSGCAILTPSASYADDKSMEKYRTWLPSQVLSMPEKKRRSEVPIAYIMSARTLDLAIQSFLNTLMYNGIADFVGAKKQFQRDLGEPETGNLTVGQITELNYRAERINLTSVSFFPFKFGGEIDDERAYVRGTAKILDENIAHPVNHTEIHCTKSEGVCSYRQFVLTLPDKTSWSQSYMVMETVNDKYRITRWEGDQIDARPMHEGTCRVPELRLSFSNKEFYEIVRNAAEGKCDLLLGGSFPKLDKPRISQIVDGDPLIREKFSELRKEAYKFLSSEFRTKADIVFGIDQTSQAGKKSN